MATSTTSATTRSSSTAAPAAMLVQSSSVNQTRSPAIADPHPSARGTGSPVATIPRAVDVDPEAHRRDAEERRADTAPAELGLHLRGARRPRPEHREPQHAGADPVQWAHTPGVAPERGEERIADQRA